MRRNTSCALRMTAKDGRSVWVVCYIAFLEFYCHKAYLAELLLISRTIVIDAGKNFQAAALEWFPKYSLRCIDALLLTHSHADGMCFISSQVGSCLSSAQP